MVALPVSCACLFLSCEKGVDFAERFTEVVGCSQDQTIGSCCVVALPVAGACVLLSCEKSVDFLRLTEVVQYSKDQAIGSYCVVGLPYARG
jgi:hypothetical protein